MPIATQLVLRLAPGAPWQQHSKQAFFRWEREFDGRNTTRQRGATGTIVAAAAVRMLTRDASI
jgi:hypothetical protein